MGYFNQVYEIVKKIPAGKVATYGQIAELAGKTSNARVVGWALHGNPYEGIVPCHRVVNRFGQPSENFAFGGKNAQRKLLEAEGIIFDQDGIIDLKEYLWKPE